MLFASEGGGLWRDCRADQAGLKYMLFHLASDRQELHRLRLLLYHSISRWPGSTASSFTCLLFHPRPLYKDPLISPPPNPFPTPRAIPHPNPSPDTTRCSLMPLLPPSPSSSLPISHGLPLPCGDRRPPRVADCIYLSSDVPHRSATRPSWEYGQSSRRSYWRVNMAIVGPRTRNAPLATTCAHQLASFHLLLTNS